ncbi:hypothetical protein, partial [Paenibacillus sp. IHB B 3415]|uniref:hypothetical protein n=1 Tax=Paenibacillus sp. IHB B 3415 TaxID=867080 RepID=UPI001F394416
MYQEPTESPGSRQHGEIKGINPSNSAENELYDEIKGISPSDSAESVLYGEIKGINPSNHTRTLTKGGSEEQKWTSVKKVDVELRDFP